MAPLVVFADKNINPGRLHDELEQSTIGLPNGIKWAGFTSPNARVYEPFTETRVIATSTGQPDVTADPGELHFRYDPELTGVQEDVLEQLLLDHDHTQLSRQQQNEDSDAAAIAPLINNYQNWGSLNAAAKDNNHRQLTRLVARLLDKSQDV